MTATPGPWVYDRHDCTIYSTTEIDEDCGPTGVVCVYGAMGGDDSDADIRLITAAPELLVALQLLLNAMETPRSLKATAAWTEARSTIARATGAA